MANQWHFNFTFQFDVLNKQLLYMFNSALSNIQSPVNPSFHSMHNEWMKLICIFEWFFLLLKIIFHCLSIVRSDRSLVQFMKGNILVSGIIDQGRKLNEKLGKDTIM